MRVPDELARRLPPQADLYVVARGDSMSSVGYHRRHRRGEAHPERV